MLGKKLGARGLRTGARRRRRVVAGGDHVEGPRGRGALPQPPARSFLRTGSLAQPAVLAMRRTTPPTTRLTASPAAEALRSKLEKSASMAQPPRPRAEGVALLSMIRLLSILRPTVGPRRFALRAAAVALAGVGEGSVPEDSGQKRAIDARARCCTPQPRRKVLCGRLFGGGPSAAYCMNAASASALAINRLAVR